MPFFVIAPSIDCTTNQIRVIVILEDGTPTKTAVCTCSTKKNMSTKSTRAIACARPTARARKTMTTMTTTAAGGTMDEQKLPLAHTTKEKRTSSKRADQRPALARITNKDKVPVATNSRKLTTQPPSHSTKGTTAAPKAQQDTVEVVRVSSRSTKGTTAVPKAQQDTVKLFRAVKDRKRVTVPAASKPKVAKEQSDLLRVLDVDANDADDPAYCTEYIFDIHTNLREQETQPCYTVQSSFLSRHTDLRCHHRVALINWLVHVAQKMSCVPETLYLTVDIIDRYLNTAPSVLRTEFQLVGVSAFFIASKFEDIIPPMCRDLSHFTADSSTPKDILGMEHTVLKMLGYRLSKPTAITFLRRYSKVAMTPMKSHHLAKYILELVLLSTSLSAVSPSLRAAATLFFSRSLLFPRKTNAELWPVSLVHHSGYTVPELMLLQDRLRQVLREFGTSSTAESIPEKYASRAFLSVSRLHFPTL